MRLHLAIVSETWAPEVNGVAMTLGHLVAGLREAGHRVQVVRPRQAGEAASDSRGEKPDELCLPGLPFPGYASLRLGLPAPRRLLAEWRHRRPDWVHIVTEGPLGWSALWAARRLGIPVSSSFHTYFDRYCEHYHLGWLAPLLRRHLLALHRRAALTFVPTTATARELAEQDIHGLEIMGRGCDTQCFNPTRRDDTLRAHWAARPGTLVCLYVGRLAAEKNLGLAEAAFAAIARQHPDARMVWVGDGPARQSLMARHPDHHFPGQLGGTTLAAHYASADLFLFPSLTETYGNVVPEAMACGLPVIAFRRAAAAELIEHDINGCLIDPGAPDSFIESACHLANASTHRAKLGQAAAVAASGRSWSQVVNRFTTPITRMLQSTKCHEAVTIAP